MAKQEIENAIAECLLTPETDEVVESNGEAMTLQPCVEQMPKKRQILAVDSDDDEKDEYQPTKRTKKESKEVITLDSDEEVVNENPKTPKTTPKSKSKKKEKEVQKNTLHNYFFIGNKTTPTSSSKSNESTPTSSKKKEKDMSATPKSSKLRLDESPIKSLKTSPMKLDAPELNKSLKTSPIKLDAPELRKSPTKLILDDDVQVSTTSPKIKENTRSSDTTVKESTKIEKKTKQIDKSAHSGKNDKIMSSEGKGKPEHSKINGKHKESETSHGDRKRQGKDSVDQNHSKVMKIEKPASSAPPKSAEKPKMGDKRRSGGGGNYAAYLHREGPREIGLKDIPEGEPNILLGMTFVLTGVLESMEREDAKDLIEKCGGKVTTGVSKKTAYLVAGREPGISKISKAEQLKVKQINEDELLDLIRSKMTTEKKPNLEITKSIDEMESTYFAQKKSPVRDASSKLEAQVKRSPDVQKPNTSKVTDLDVKRKMNPAEIPASNGKHMSSASTTQGILWVDKYKPQTMKQLVGQQAPGSVAQKLLVWLRSWHRHFEEGTKKSGSVGFTRGARDDGCLFKAALLSGPPGIGKTTAATLVCQELGFSFVERNASDTRSKRSLKEEVSESVGSHSVVDFLQDSNKNGKKHCLLMDEVDGMAGNEDRGGIAELIQVIKQSKIPIICMCNDRSHQKMRSLVNYCFDLRFQRPRVDQIKGAMMSIVCKEGLSIPQSAVGDIITASNNDIRQTINNLEMWTASEKKLTDEQIKKDSSKAKKDLRYNVFDVIKKILAPEMNDDKSIRGMTDLFFQDYQMGPLFVQENYLNVRPSASGSDPDAALTLMSKTADAIAMGDIVNRRIRTGNNWGLLTTQALFSTVLPGHHMRGNLTAGIGFPSWLGKFSSRRRCSRLLQQLSNHMRLSTGGIQPSELAMGSGKAILHHITSPLIRRGSDGVNDTINALRSYDLLREDLDILSECSLWSMQRDPMSQVDSKTKGALTRAYNKAGIMTPYALTAGGTKKGRGRGGGGDDLDGDIEDAEENAEEEEDDEDITKDAMVKVSKAKASSKRKGNEKAATSKKKKQSESVRNRVMK